VEIDRQLEPFSIAEATRGVRDPLDRGIQSFGHRIRDPMDEVGADVLDVPPEHAGDLDHRREA